MWISGVARAAETTLAVLPLAKAAGSDSYEGLGKALAGMLVSDLSAAPSVQLVERDRLDAVLAEIALGDTAFLDPKTAQRLGKGVGAEAVLTGSYSVVGDVFLLDARIVETRSARVLKAAAAQGTIAEFVAVEKDVMEQLLDRLDVELDSAARRRLLMDAPTEAWEAFTEYGEGLEARDQGRLEDAATSFEAALRADPKFELARAALSDLRAMLEAEAARSRQRADTAHADAEAAVLAAWPAPVLPPPPGADVTAKMDASIGFALRSFVLEDQERWCERYRELEAHLEHVGWQVAPPERTPSGAWTYLLGQRAEALGYGPISREVPAPKASYESVFERANTLRDTWRYVMGGPANLHKGEAGLIGALRQCHPPAERPAEIDRLRALAAKHGAAGIVQDPSRARGYTLDEALTIAWAAAVAAHEGATPELEARGQALLATRDVEDPERAQLRRDLEQVAAAAEAWQTSRWRRLAQPEEALIRTMRGLADADPAVVRTEGGIACAHLVKEARNRARDWVDGLAEKEGTPYRAGHLDVAGQQWGMLRDAGCLVDTPPRFDDADALFAFLASASERARPEAADDSNCRQGFETLDRLTTPQAMASSRATPELAAWGVYTQLIVYHAQIVWHRCVEVP